jgi:LPXTG-motif cell wall-anchored protein
MATVKKPPAKPAPLPGKPNQTMTLSQVKNIWIKAGGNPQAADMAAAMADASSGLNPNATFTNPDGSVGVGLWLIDKNGMPPGSTDPLANARAAVEQSNNGTNWKNWCVAWSDNACGQNGGNYLEDGSNALGALGGSYNVAGATPTGTGTSATTASATTPSTPSSGGSNKFLMIGAVLLVGFGIFYFYKKQRDETPIDIPTDATIPPVG